MRKRLLLPLLAAIFMAMFLLPASALAAEAGSAQELLAALSGEGPAEIRLTGPRSSLPPCPGRGRRRSG